MEGGRCARRPPKPPFEKSGGFLSSRVGARVPRASAWCSAGGKPFNPVNHVPSEATARPPFVRREQLSRNEPRHQPIEPMRLPLDFARRHPPDHAGEEKNREDRRSNPSFVS